MYQWRIQDFPEVGRGPALTYDFAKIFQKLHEIERIWTPMGCARFAEISLNLYSVDFHTFTLHLLIQTSLSVVPEVQVFCEFT